MNARNLLITYFVLSLVVVLAARPILLSLDASILFVLLWILGPLGFMYLAGIGADGGFLKAMILYLPATVLLLGCLFLFRNRHKWIKRLALPMAIAVWIGCGYIMSQIAFYG